MKMTNAYAGNSSALSHAEKVLVKKRETLLGPAYRLFYNDPVHIVRGEGVWLFDPDGRAYLDAYNNVASVGHCHPHVVAQIASQAAILNTHTRYLNENITTYAERLLSKFPAELGHIMFTCTGSEANDLAIRIAKNFTQGTGFIVTEMAYHGVTDAVAKLSPSLGAIVSPGSHIRTIPAPDYSHSFPDEVGARFARDVKKAIAGLEQYGIKPAALMVDTIFSSDGVIVDPAGFLREAVDAVHDAGALFIADEVQAGFCRTGEAMWGFERHGITPDMVTLGKPMGNGHPIAGLVVMPKLVEKFGHETRYFNTFGGNPVSCAAGAAVLDVLENENLQTSAFQVGTYLRDGLTALAKSHEALADIRGVGLYVGVEITSRDTVHDRELAARIVNELRHRRVLISATGLRGNVLKIRPPLVFSKENADLLIEALDDVLRNIQNDRIPYE